MATSNLRVVDWHLDSINYLLLVFFKRFSFVTVALIKFPFFGFFENSGKISTRIPFNTVYDNGATFST